MLLDSQVVVWLLDDDPRLGERTRRSIADATFVHVSAATVWELTIKTMLGKLDLPPDLDDVLTSQGLVSLPVTGAHASAVRDFPAIARHDPFDRLLVAQAAREGLTLVTADRVLLALELPFVADARQ